MAVKEALTKSKGQGIEAKEIEERITPTITLMHPAENRTDDLPLMRGGLKYIHREILCGACMFIDHPKVRM